MNPSRFLATFSVTSLVLGLYTVLLLVTFTPGVMVNDDIAMMAFANGDFTGNHENQLVFIGLVVGTILRSLYDLSSGIPWYAITLVTLQVISGSLLITTLLQIRREATDRRNIGVIGLILIFMPPLVLDLSFSTTAMFVSLVGAVLFILSRSVTSRPHWIITVCSIVLMILGGSLRLEFLIAALVLVLPLFLYELKGATLRGSLVTASIIAIPVLLNVATGQLSQDNEWRDYHAFNDVRGGLHGTPSFDTFALSAYEPDTIKVIRQFGWESEDLLLFANWYLEDEKIYSRQAVTELSNQINSRPVRQSLQSSLQSVIERKEFILLIGLAMIVFARNGSSRRLATAQAFTIGWFFSVTTYVAATIRYPDHFGVPALLGLFLVLLIMDSPVVSSQNEHRTWNRLEMTTGVVVLLGCVGVAMIVPHHFSASSISIRNDRDASQLHSELKMIDENVSADRKVVALGALTVEGINPWSERTTFADGRILSLGWPSQSPHQRERRRNMGLEGSLLSNFTESNGPYLLGSPWLADLLATSIDRRLKIETRITTLATLPHGILMQFDRLQNEDDSLER